MLKLLTTVLLFRKDTRGVTALEYGLIAALIAGVIVGVVGTVGTNLKTTFSTLGGDISISATSTG